jgi:nitroreductase
MTPATAARADVAPDNSSDDTGVLERLLAERHSCRAFKPEPLPRATIERILTLAQRTASWCNSQPWQVVITSGEGTERFRKALYEHAASGAEGTSDFERPREYRGVYLARRRESGFQLYNTLGIPRGDKEGYERQAMENFRLFGAPHVAILHSDEALGTYGGVDCGGYVSNFMLAAQSMGVGTIAQAALARYSDFLHDYFKIPEDRLVVCGISFGYPDRGHLVNSYRTSRATLAETVTWVE